ncbi:MAG: pyridoxal-phosphate dependent enzyme [Deltaproteobacteria bacterium]|nr:MAG: pyridoxal-phosphate dependent enzyme [Deltaproteobacteria bacterium]
MTGSAGTAAATSRLPDLTGWFRRPPPRTPLARLPTPVERAPFLDGPDHQVFVKRDDRTSELYGGGKVRKLEYVLAEVPEGPCTSVGAIGSHHLLALGIFLHEMERNLYSWTFLQEPTSHAVRNLAALVSLQPLVWYVPRRIMLPLAAIDYRFLRRPPEPGAWIPAGASSPAGAFGFFAAACELAAQIDAGVLPAPRTVYVTAGTAGTAAGLVFGLAACRIATHVRLVSAVERPLFNRWIFASVLRRFVRFLRTLDPDPRVRDLTGPGALRALARRGVTWSIDHGQVGRGYARSTEAGLRVVADSARHGLALETTYTGKCAAALAQDVRGRGRFRPPPGPILFWNTHASTDVRRFIVQDWQERLPPALGRWVRRVGGPDLVE